MTARNNLSSTLSLVLRLLLHHFENESGCIFVQKEKQQVGSTEVHFCAKENGRDNTTNTLEQRFELLGRRNLMTYCGGGKRDKVK